MKLRNRLCDGNGIDRFVQRAADDHPIGFRFGDFRELIYGNAAGNADLRMLHMGFDVLQILDRRACVVQHIVRGVQKDVIKAHIVQLKAAIVELRHADYIHHREFAALVRRAHQTGTGFIVGQTNGGNDVRALIVGVAGDIVAAVYDLVVRYTSLSG